MLKIRLQGTVGDIQLFKKLLELERRVKVLDTSALYTNKGTNKFFRTYVDVEIQETE